MRKAGILLILFLIIVVGGRYVFGNKTSSPHVPTSSSVSTSPEKTSPISSSGSEKKQDKPLSCVEEWKQKVEREKIQYDKGSILVGFVAGVRFEEGVQIVGKYGVVIRDMKYAKENYDSRRIITGSVKAEEEFATLCRLKNDASVRYTGLNVLFELHE